MSKKLLLRNSFLQETSKNSELTHYEPLSSNFMGHFSFSRRLRSLSFVDFARIALCAHDAATRSFGTACDISISTNKATPMTTTLSLDYLDAMIKENNSASSLIIMPSLLEYAQTQKNPPPLLGFGKNRSNSNQDLTNEKSPMEKLWDDAQFVNVSIKPIKEDEAPASAWVSIDFKGKLHRHASVYAQPYNEPSYAANKVLAIMRHSLTDYRFKEGHAEHRHNVSDEIALSYFSFR